MRDIEAVLEALPWQDVMPLLQDIIDAAELAIVREALFISLASERHADGDVMLVDDLAQEARIALWDLDPTRFDETDVGFLRRAMLNAIKQAKYEEWFAGDAGRRDKWKDTSAIEGWDEEDGDAFLERVIRGEAKLRVRKKAGSKVSTKVRAIPARLRRVKRVKRSRRLRRLRRLRRAKRLRLQRSKQEGAK